MENILYPAVLDCVDGYCISFPGSDMIDCCAESLDEALNSAKEVLALHIVDNEEEGVPFLIPSGEEYELNEREQLIYLNVWLPYELAKMKTEYKKKTLTIPTWLDLLASRKNINFSQVLVDGLKKELGFSI